MTAPDRLLWVVVKVESGIPVSVDACRVEPSATRRERLLRKRMGPENDATGGFRVKMGKPTLAADTSVKHFINYFKQNH